MSFFEYFGTVILVSLFWSVSFTMITRGINPNDLGQLVVIDFQNAEGIETNYSETARQFQEGLQAQSRVGIVDLGALVYYSGNIMLDLATNFFFAIPAMFTLLFGAIFKLFQIDAFLQRDFLAWIQIVFAVIASITLLKFVLGVRSQSLGAV